ncbi:MAG: DUF2147 domain-containing protein [Henriciella sp.]|uniref:DUF2147 domain-containing protein n=1 Tax=Henriciella sp. TaxID=1968823 RepID=UPI003C76F898
MRSVSGLMVLAIALAPGPAVAGDLSDLVGTWRTVRHGADIRISNCGDGTPCGTLISVDLGIVGDSTRDENNRDKVLRSRPLDGLPILWGYSNGSDGWRNGRLYNPETGQTFRSSLSLISQNELKVRGCLGPLCRSQIWTRILSPTNQSIEE